jgi:nucleoside-diphosphate-sugar epimerase
MVRVAGVALLGGTGFIGRRVARRLVEGGAAVSTIQRGRTASTAAVPGAQSITADRSDPAALRAALAEARPVVLVDMIAYTAADADRLLDALPGPLERLVVISSGDVYWTYGGFLGHPSSDPPTAPLDESAAVRTARYPYRAQAAGPDDRWYDYEKLDVEERLRAGSPVPVTVLRLPMVYGPGDPQRRVAGALERLESSRGTLRLNPVEAAWRATRGYVDDVADAIALATLHARAVGATYNVGEAEALSEREWIAAVAGAAGWRGEVIADPGTPPSLPAHWEFPLVTSTGRIREQLGYEERVGRAEGVRRSVEGRGGPVSP